MESSSCDPTCAASANPFEHGLMMPVMLVPMLVRRDLYTGRADHAMGRAQCAMPWPKLVGFADAAVPMVNDHEAIVARIERLEAADAGDHAH